MSSERSVKKIDETDSTSAAASPDLASSVAKCRQITVTSEVLVPGRTAATEQRASAVSVHKTMVLMHREPGEPSLAQSSRRSSSRKATLSFDFAALQASARAKDPENLAASHMRIKAPSAGPTTAAVSAPMLGVSAPKQLSRYAVMAVKVMLLSMLLAATFLLGRSDSEPQTPPRLLHLVVPRQGPAAPSEDSALSPDSNEPSGLDQAE